MTIFSPYPLQNHKIYAFLLKSKKMVILRYGQCLSQWSYFQGHKIIYIYFLGPILQISFSNPEFSGSVFQDSLWITDFVNTYLYAGRIHIL